MTVLGEDTASSERVNKQNESIRELKTHQLICYVNCENVLQVVFLKNRGVLVGGESIEEVFHLLRRVMNAVDTQVCIMSLVSFAASCHECR